MGMLSKFYSCNTNRVWGRYFGFMNRMGLMPFPQFVQWQVTDSCNMACKHCYARSGHKSANEMTTEEVKRLLIDEMADMGVKAMLVTGGEPLTREDLFDVIGYAQSKDIAYYLNTNGSFVRRRGDDLRRYPPDFVAVSLDGIEDTHNSFRGSGTAFRDALDSIRFFKEIGVKTVVLGTTLTRKNIGELEFIADVFRQSGADEWGLHMIIPEGRAREHSEIMPTDEQLRYVLDFVVRMRGELPVQIADEIGYCGNYEEKVRNGFFFCGAGRTTCLVLPDGEVVPCGTCERMYSAGNIREMSFSTIWDKGFSDLRNPQLPKTCMACESRPQCMGGCWLQRKNGNHCFKRIWNKARNRGGVYETV